MEITYDTRKNLPCEKLYRLFLAVGWSEENIAPELLAHFNIGFLRSTLVFSAWHGDTLVGCVRVLSDQIFRSVIYDMAVLPAYQGRGIGTALMKKCLAAYPDSEWLVGTETAAGFYQKLGFCMPGPASEGVILSIPGRWSQPHPAR